MIFAVALGARKFVVFIAITGIAENFADWATFVDLPPLGVLFALSIVYVLLGMFLNSRGLMLLTLPVLVPVIARLGYDVIWFAIIVIKHLEIGLITPPLGLNVYILKGVVVDAVSLETIFDGVVPFLVTTSWHLAF